MFLRTELIKLFAWIVSDNMYIRYSFEKKTLLKMLKMLDKI